MQFKGSSSNQSHVNEIKLKGGQSVVGILRGEPIEFESAFKLGDKPKFRFHLNMVVNEDGVLVAKVLSGGWKLYGQLKQLSESGWDLERYYTKVSRQGTTINDTVYSATVLPVPPTPEALIRVAAVKLHVLTPPSQAPALSDSHEPPVNDESFGAF